MASYLREAVPQREERASSPAGRLLSLVRRLRGIVLYSFKGVSYGRFPVVIGRAPIVDAPGRFEVGRWFIVRARQIRPQLATAADGALLIGDRVTVNQGVTIYARERVEIGDNALLGDFVCIYDTNFHEVEEGAGVLTSPVTIGRNVWLARGAVVLPGVTIGDNCVIGANAVVSSSIPSNSLVAGNPARVLRTLRFSDGYTRAGLT